MSVREYHTNYFIVVDKHNVPQGWYDGHFFPVALPHQASFFRTEETPKHTIICSGYFYGDAMKEKGYKVAECVITYKVEG